MGFANCSCGCENHLLKLCDQIDFVLGGPNDPLYEDLSEEKLKLMVSSMRYEKIIEGMKNRRKRRKMKKQQE